MISTAGLIGGLAIPKQERLLRKHPQIIVGTPGRIWYFMEQKKLGAACLHHVRFVIGDEADKLVWIELIIRLILIIRLRLEPILKLVVFSLFLLKLLLFLRIKVFSSFSMFIIRIISFYS